MDFEADIKWLWAAYRHGEAGFASELFPKGLEKPDFEHRMWTILQDTDAAFMMEAKVGERNVIPVGIAVMRSSQPHFEWFWWASGRNKIEAGLKFFVKLSEDIPFVIAIDRDASVYRYALHLQKYGVIRRVGTSFNWSPKTVMALFESKG